MTRMYTSCFLVLSLLGFAVAVNECSDKDTCQSARSWTEAAAAEDEGLQLLQSNWVPKAGKSEADASAEDKAQEGASSTEADGDEGASAVAKIHAHVSAKEDAEEAKEGDSAEKAKEDDTAAKNAEADGSAPLNDQKGAPEKKVQPKEDEVVFVDGLKVAEKNGCPVPDGEVALAKVGKGCPHVGACLNNNNPFKSLADAWEGCAVDEFCGAVMQFSDGKYYLRRESDPDIQDESARLFEYPCKKAAYTANAIEVKAQAKAKDIMEKYKKIRSFKEKVEMHEAKAEVAAERDWATHEIEESIKTRDAKAKELKDAEQKLAAAQDASAGFLKTEKERRKDLIEAEEKLKVASQKAAKEQDKLDKYLADLKEEKSLQAKEKEEAAKLAEAKHKVEIAVKVEQNAEKKEKETEANASRFTSAVPKKIKELKDQAQKDLDAKKELEAKEKEEEQKLHKLGTRLHEQIAKSQQDVSAK